MMWPMRPGPALVRRCVLVASTALVVPLASGCGLLDGLLGGSPLEEALEYAPAGSTVVEFVDRTAIVERLGVDDVDADSGEQDLVRYVTAYDDAAAGTRLLSWVSVMRSEASFSDLDVEWETTTEFADTSAWAWKLSDDVDLDEVAADLEDAGYEQSDTSADDVAVLAAPDGTRASNGLNGGRYPRFLDRIALVPDEHLVVAGDGLAEVLDVVLDDAESLVDDGGFQELLEVIDPDDDVELAQLERDDAVCRVARVARPRGPAAALLEDLGTPADAALVVADDGPPTAVLRFADEDAAEADASAREAYLAAVGRRSAFGPAYDVAAHGSTVRVQAQVDDTGAGTLPRFVRAESAGGGSLACSPE